MEMQEKNSPSREKIKCGDPVKEASLPLEEQQQNPKQCGWNIQGRRVVWGKTGERLCDTSRFLLGPRTRLGPWLVLNNFVLNEWMKLEGFELDSLKVSSGWGSEHVGLCKAGLEELKLYSNHQKKSLEVFKQGDCVSWFMFWKHHCCGE